MSPLAARRRRARLLAPAAIAGTLVAGLLAQPPAGAYNTVPLASGDRWMFNDAGAPGVDTGSVRSTSANALQGYGGIRMDVDGAESPLNGILLRGFGLAFDGIDSFSSLRSVELDGVAVKREVQVDQAGGYGRFFDTFTNTTGSTISVDVAFGGQLGFDTGTNQTSIAGTSSGDTAITSADGWASWYSPSAGAGSASFNGPSATTTGTPGFAGSLDRTGNFLKDPFGLPMATSGDEANHPGLVNTIELEPGETRSLAHFVVTGFSEVRATPGGGAIPAAGSQVDAVEARATQLTASPDFAGLSTGEICSLVNYDVEALSVAGFDAADCPATRGEPLPDAVGTSYTPPVVRTTSPYDVVGKTITDLLADMKSGKTTAEQITRAYLDRIAAYDQGPLGLKSVIAVAPDAMAQARAMDRARRNGDTRPLLGVPILVKDIVDTKDMPTTGGSSVFKGYQPTKDAWQVAKLREAGALILGKSNLAEFANDGHYSASSFGKVWNAFDPSRSAIGSSGGSGTAVASSFAAAAIGTQTGDSLWGPSGAMSLYTMRGTDGMQSGDGTMPLTVVQDYVGFMTKSLPDLALLLEAAAVGNPGDPLDDVADGRRPAAWKPFLDANALQGRVIGVPAEAFDDPFGTTYVSDAMREQFVHFEAAGATLKDIPAPPAAPASVPNIDANYEGWRQWIAAHPDNPYTLPQQITRSPLRLADRRITTPYTGVGGMSPEQLKAYQDRRAAYRELLATWMDDNGVDVVLFPTQLSEVHLNDSTGNSFGRRDPQSSASGVPTVIVPAGLNDRGHPIGFQLQGKAFQDGELMAMAYAFDQRAKGHVVPRATTPPLVYDANAIPAPVQPVTPIPPTPPTAPAARQLTVLAKRATATRKGAFPIEVGCASAAGACVGKVVVRWGAKQLKAKQVTVRPGLRTVVWVKPGPGVKRKLANGKAVRVQVRRVGKAPTVTSAPIVVTVRR